MTMGLAFLLMAAFLVFAFGMAFYMQKRNIEALRRVASELGYEFISGGIPGAAIRRGPEAPEINAAPGASPIQEPEVPAALKGILSFLAPWRIKGREGNESVDIYTVTRGSGRSRTTYTVVDMSVRPKESGFKITKEGFFSKVGKTIFGLQDIQIGDPEFDAKAMVKGADPEAVKRLLSSSRLRQAILHGLEAYPSLCVTDAKINFERSGGITQTDFFRALIQAMSEIAQAMRE